ncbi:MAG: helix-turn-helix domain-containing protein [Ktedonobacterales bacterium]
MSRSSLYKLILTGEIPSIKVGRMRRIPLKSLQEWVMDQLAA